MKQQHELEFTRRFLADIELQYTSLVSSDRPDIRAVIADRNIGIEVTVFHADEGNAHKPNEDTLRQEGERTARETPDQIHTTAIPTLPYAALEARINAKIAKAAQYDPSHIDELWLLIPAQQPTLGALAATYVSASLVNQNELNRMFHEKLLASHFSRVYWHLIGDHAIIGWDGLAGWQIVRQREEPDTYGREVLNRIRQTRPL